MYSSKRYFGTFKRHALKYFWISIILSWKVHFYSVSFSFENESERYFSSLLVQAFSNDRLNGQNSCTFIILHKVFVVSDLYFNSAATEILKLKMVESA